LTAGIFTHVLQPLLGTATADKAFEFINGILPDFAIDARGARFSELLKFTDSSCLDGVETLVDTKGLGVGESSYYVSFRADQGQLKPINRRAIKVHKAYCKAAKDLDSKHNNTPDDEICPVLSALLSFGPVAGKYEGTVIGLGVGCFNESCLMDSMMFARSSRAIVRYPMWIATTTSRPRRPLACSAQGSAACEVMRPFSPGAALSWIASKCSLACSHPPPAPRVRVATPVITSRFMTSSTPSPRTPDAVFTPVRGG